MTLFPSNLIILDSETTGFPGQAWAAVIELAAVLLDRDGNEVATFEQLVHPGSEILMDERIDGALAINKITREMLADQMRTEEVVDAFEAWYHKHPGRRSYATSFNIGFDRKMVDAMGVRDTRWCSCIMERSTAVMGPAGRLQRGKWGKEWLWPKLSVAAEFFGVQIVGEQHRALTDARAAAGIACAIRRLELGVTQQSSAAFTSGTEEKEEYRHPVEEGE